MPSPSNAETRELWADKIRFANTLKGGAIFCVYNQAQAKICEKVGAKALIAVGEGAISGGGDSDSDDSDDDVDVYRMADPGITKSIMDCVALPVFGRVRVGHEMEARITQHICVDGIHEYDKLTAAADAGVHIAKLHYKVPFICAAANLGEALQRISEGASMIHTKGGSVADNPNVAASVTELKKINAQIKKAVSKLNNKTELKAYAKEIGAPFSYLEQVAKRGSLPVPLFGHGGVVEPADAAYLMAQKCDGLIISANVLTSMDSQRRALGMVMAVENPTNYEMLAKISENLGVPPV
ncbi:Pyridoxal 5'-phosphate synthase subunit snz1 [Coemansia sp. RSA 1200]|nr:Pyridoxal 5'-phosphate synthase subunit snz1 [Coemansia sp. RSA 1200]